MEVTFISTGVQVIFVKALEDLTDMFMVLFHVVRVDEDVIQVDEDTYIENVREDVIHEVLKSCWCISQTEGHNTPFKSAIVGVEGGFPFITFMDSNEVVGVLQVDFGIHGSLSWAVKEVRDAWKWISVFLCYFVEALKVGSEMERAIFLSSKEDQSTVR